VASLVVSLYPWINRISGLYRINPTKYPGKLMEQGTNLIIVKSLYFLAKNCRFRISILIRKIEYFGQKYE